MATSKLNAYSYAVNHQQAVSLIAANGSKLSYVFEGEPGVGKSSMLKTLAAQLGNEYDYIYVDVPMKDIPDIALSMPDHATQTTKAYINSLWQGSDPNKKKIVMLDEVFKGTDIVRLMMNRLLLEQRVGDYKLPDGSIVFGTTNFATDGVGDRSSGHTNSRVARIPMRKPTMEEWKHWAINNNVHELVLTWATQNPSIFYSYMDTEFEQAKHDAAGGIFHYIFHPKYNYTSYVCPRTLELASHQIHNMDKLGIDLITRSLIGTFGMKAAMDITAMIELGNDLPHPDTITADPSRAHIPKNSTAQMMMVFKSVQYVKAETVDAYAIYFNRFPKEMTSTWIKTLVDTTNVKEIAVRNQSIRSFAVANAWILGG